MNVAINRKSGSQRKNDSGPRAMKNIFYYVTCLILNLRQYYFTNKKNRIVPSFIFLGKSSKVGKKQTSFFLGSGRSI